MRTSKIGASQYRLRIFKNSQNSCTMEILDIIPPLKLLRVTLHICHRMFASRPITGRGFIERTV